MVLSRVRLIRVKLVLVNLNPINDTYIQGRDILETGGGKRTDFPDCAATDCARFWDKISKWRKGSLKDCFPYEFGLRPTLTEKKKKKSTHTCLECQTARCTQRTARKSRARVELGVFMPQRACAKNLAVQGLRRKRAEECDLRFSTFYPCSGGLQYTLCFLYYFQCKSVGSSQQERRRQQQ